MYYFCIGNSADGDKVIHGKTHNIRGIEPLYIVRKLCLWFKMYSGNCFFTFEAKNGHTKSGINTIIHCQPLIIICQSSITNCHLLIINCQPLIINCQLSIIHCQASTFSLSIKIKTFLKKTKLFLNLP